MSTSDYTDLTARLKVLADPARLEILQMLQLNRGGLTVLEITERLGRLQQPTVSHHLRILHAGGLVKFKRNGQFVRYWRDGRVLDDTVEALTRLL